MSLRSRATSAPVLQVLLPLSLLLTALVPSTTGQTEINLYAELRCLCVKTFSGIHPSNIQNLEVHRAGPHCSKIEVIAKLKNGKEICLDPDAPRVIKILQKILENDKPAI
uniref:C-X-C motif chemokine n=1 Tax=Molossus molossus TaxID=27622 RepID=A0A7J8K073_MOLMO|nr:pro-platelet basic protein [Molossus molossus]